MKALTITCEGMYLKYTPLRAKALAEVCAKCTGKCCRVFRIDMPRKHGDIDRDALRARGTADAKFAADNFMPVAPAVRKLVDDGDRYDMALTCKQFDDACAKCRVHPDRPDICRRYACRSAVFDGVPPRTSAAQMESDKVCAREVADHKPTALWRRTLGRWARKELSKAKQDCGPIDAGVCPTKVKV